MLYRINIATAINVAQVQRINKLITSSKNTHFLLKLQIKANKRSVDSLAKELEKVKKDQARQRAESIVQYEKHYKAQLLAEEKHKKFHAFTNENISRLYKTFKGMEKKLKEELKD